MYNVFMDKSATERETFIVQNITLNYHVISDIGLQFKPREVIDLTWEDEAMIKKSRNLKESLRTGILKKLTEEEYNKTLDMQYQRERKQLLREQQNKDNLKKITADDKEMMADTFDVAKGKKKQAELDITGTANHPMSYVAAYEIASQLADNNGDVLTAEEFGEIVSKDPGIVPRLLSQTKQASADSGHTAYYAVPNESNISGVVKTQMTNYNKAYLSNLDSDTVEAKTAYIRDMLDVTDDSGDDEGFAEEIIIDTEE